jgi:predicted anti-sigma-YlaC factor YlaD
MRAAIEVAAVVAFLTWFVFVVWYSVRARWWRSPEGRNIWGVGFALTVALGMIVAAYTWPDYSARPYVVLTVYVGLAALGIQRTIQLERAQRRHRKEGH